MILYSTYACAVVIFLSNDIEDNVDATIHIVRGCIGGKQKATTLGLESQTTGDANIRHCKDCQLNWNFLELMALIHAKKKEHEVTKSTKMPEKKMETAMTKWTRIAHNIRKAGFSNFYYRSIA